MTPKTPSPLEHVEQSSLFAWAKKHEKEHPELSELFAVPNFSGRLGRVPPIAAIRQAQKLNREGRKKGIEDVMLLIARGGYHGLLVEMKRRDATDSDVSPEQRRWHKKHTCRGYKVVVARGWEEASKAILDYIAQPVTKVVYPKPAKAA